MVCWGGGGDSKVGIERVYKKNVSKACKGKEKVEEGKGKEKVVVGNKKWTKQAIKLSKSPSKKGTKRKTSDNLCKFRLWGSWMQNEASFQIKTLIPDHNCARVFNFGALVTYKWIARHYFREILSNPKLSTVNYMLLLGKVNLDQCKLWDKLERAKQRALYDFEGGKTYFKSYMSILVDVAMKDGWTAGCRKVIGLDGCFLKGTINGELLTAMGRDANNQMFPIAWAVGIKEAVRRWLTIGRQRQCCGTSLANLKKSLARQFTLKSILGAASATLKHVFDEKMKLLSNLNEKIIWLVERDPNTWSRAFFQMDRSCGAFENGICESYHAAIINQRVGDLTDIITPYVRITNLKNLKEYLRLWEVYLSGYREFEVRKLNEGYGVNLETHKLKTAWQNVILVSLNLVSGQSMWVKTGLPPPMPPKKRVMPGRPKRKRQKHPSEVNDSSSQRMNCDPPPKEVRPKGKRKGGQNGFESASSALKRMRMDATASGSGLSEIQQMQILQMQIMQMQICKLFKKRCETTGDDGNNMCTWEEHVQEVDVKEPVQEAVVQDPVLEVV
ncbi:hypothetical protein Tco_0411457 [Tanacetum coccineum]